MSAGSILVLIGAIAPARAEAETTIEVRAQTQTAARTGVRETTGQGQSDVLGRRVTVNLVDSPLGTALETIAGLADFVLAYDPGTLPASRTVTVNAFDLPVRDALARMLEGTGLEPAMTRTGQITLVPRPDPSPRAGDVAAAPTRQEVVTGTVTDEGTSEVLRGAQVHVDGLELSAVTNAEGRYTLGDVPPGTHTLVAHIIGYREGRQEVTVAAGATVSADFALAVSALPLDEVVATGTMVPTRMRAVPSPVSVITADDIERKGMIRFEDILRGIPGAGVTTTGGHEYQTVLYVRGANTFDVTRSTIKTYIDGVEVANPFVSLSQIDPSTIDRIELIRGPQASTLHGSEAIAGVLQVFTKKGRIGTGRHEAKMHLAVGGLQSQYKDGLTPVQEHNLTITGGEQNLSYNVGASYSHTGEWVEDELIDELGWDVPNSAIQDLNVFGGLRYVSGRFTASISARGVERSRGGPLEAAIAERARSGRWNYPYYTKPSGLDNQISVRTYGVNAEYMLAPDWHHELTVGMDVTAMESRRFQPRRMTPADTFLLYQTVNWSRRSVGYKTSFQIALADGISSTVQGGVDHSTYSHLDVLTNDATQLVGGLGNEHADLTRGTATNYGFYLQTQTAMHDELFLTAGVRADRSSGFGDDFGFAWSPRVGLAHVLQLGALTLKSRASYGRAIRPPDPQQKFGRTAGNYVYLENRNLEPEAQAGYDLGLEVHGGQRFSIGVTRYAQQARNLVAVVLLSDPSVFPQIQQYQNVGGITNKGWEFEGMIALGSFAIDGHYALLDSRVERLSATYTGTEFVVGQVPLSVPRSTGDISVSYLLAHGTIALAMSHKGSWQQYRYIPYFNALYGTDPDRDPYTGNRRDYVNDYPAVQRYRLSISHDLWRNVKATAVIDNLFNETAPDRRDIDLVRGRQLLIGAQFAFDL